MNEPFQPTRYTVCDGDLTLVLETAEEGGFVVTCPFDPALITQAETLQEAFEMGRDARDLLREVRREDTATARRQAEPAAHAAPAGVAA